MPLPNELQNNTLADAEEVMENFNYLDNKSNGVGLVNGKIVVSVSSDDLIIAIKTMAGNDPSEAEPVFCRIGDAIRKLTSALSMPLADGTNWFNSAQGILDGQEIDYFAYLGYNVDQEEITLAVSRIPWAEQYSYFSTTSNNNKYGAVNNRTGADADDPYTNIGRFSATLSSAYDWTIAGTEPYRLIQRPIFETRWLSFDASFASVTKGNGTYSAKYKVVGRTLIWRVEFTFGSTSVMGSNAGLGSLPFTTTGSSTDGRTLVEYYDAGSTNHYKGCFVGSVFTPYNVIGSYVQVTTISSTIPFTWATNDTIAISTVAEEIT